MKHTFIALTALLGLAALVGAAPPQGCGQKPASATQATGSSGNRSGAIRVQARLTGYEETPAISSAGSGRFRAAMAPDGQSFEFELSYADLEGGMDGAVTAAHIHLGQRGVAGGVAVHLCGGGGGTAPCPPSPATITGTFGADNVVGPAGQGLAAGELEELVRAMRAGVTYVNVHNATYPSGEIRGQLRPGGGSEDEDEHEEDD
ncbi:MAG TPA: CHRD domain-containing protein [Anaeromyxobacteraceae bacterium]|nr:CHRD domain-containing protein [Anaeromyxobacteraceae bacterium]